MGIQEDNSDRREQVARATWRVIAERGIHGASMRAIAREAGCTTGVLVHYFSDKDELLLFALNLANDKLQSRVDRAASHKSGLEALRAMIHAALPLDEERLVNRRIWLEFSGRALSSPDLAKAYVSLYAFWRQFTRDALEEAQVTGALCSEIDLDSEADWLVAFIDGLCTRVHFERERFTVGYLKTLADNYLQRLSSFGSQQWD